MAPFLTSDDQNHNHIFIGMNSGNVHIYDISKKKFTNFTIRPGSKMRVAEIKCQPEKMHRILIAFSSQVCIYSLNK